MQKKFPHLELSVLKLSEAQRDNETKRIDSEFFKKEYLENEEIILKHEWDYLGNLAKSIINFGAYSLCNYIEYVDKNDGVPFLNVGDIRENSINYENAKYIPLNTSKNILHKSLAKENQVLLTIAGSIGFAAVSYRLPPFTNSNQAIANIEILTTNPFYLSTYLNCRFGKSQMNKLTMSSVQPNLLLTQVKQIKIPLLPMSFQLEIEKLVKDSHLALEQSKVLYKQAEELLYTELGLNPQNPLASVLSCSQTPTRPFRGAEHWEKGGSSASANAKLEMDIARHSPISEKAATFLRAGERGEGAALFAIEENEKSIQSNKNITSCNPPNCTIKTLKESFLKTGRLDSEYYQVKYEEIESFIQSYQGGFSKLEIMEIKDSNFTPQAKEKYRYIELANIGSNGNISAPLEELGEDLPTRARRLVKEGDLIISSVEGSLGSCALITKEFHHCIVSTGFYVLKSHSINSETLLVLFKSQFFQDYLKKFPSGTILSAISKEELQNILIPKINPNTQDSIASHIQQSFILRNEAKALLEEAKAKVESAIIGGGGK